jgi:NIPSNAP
MWGSWEKRRFAIQPGGSVVIGKKLVLTSLFAAVFASGFILGSANNQHAGLTIPAQAQAQAAARVFELRTYTSHEGRLQDVVNRFRDHTRTYFDRHGMTSIGYWTPQDAPLSQNTLIYVLAHPSRDAAKKSWDAFRADPDWQKARDASEANGKIVAKIESVFLSPTGYSALK